MATTHSAGVVLHRYRNRTLEILLVHPGGPFWAKKDTHGWSIPKGEYDPEQESAKEAAWREFHEEVGHRLPDGDGIELSEFRAGSKKIKAWLVEGDVDPTSISSNTFEMEWPPKSGQVQAFPEVDRAEWFDIEAALTKLHKGQAPLCQLILDAL